MSITLDGGEDGKQNAWYVSYDVKGLHAGMWVFIDDMRLEDEEDHEEMAIPWDLFERAASEFADHEDNAGRVTRVPEGMVTHDRYDDVDEEDLEGSLDNYLWRFTSATFGKMRTLHVLLMLPWQRRDDPLLCDLAVFIGREMRRVEFPGFDRWAGG